MSITFEAINSSSNVFNKIGQLTEQINETTKIIDNLEQDLNIFITLCTKKIDEYALKLSQQISLSNISTSSCSVQQLDFDDMLIKKNEYVIEIASHNKYLISFKKELEIAIMNRLLTTKEWIIVKMQNHPILKSSECSICLQFSPLVDLILPCRAIDQSTGRPKCEGSICIECASRITGLSIDRTTPFIIKCPICNSGTPRPTNNTNTFALNMPLMRAVDSYLTYENSIFMQNFKAALKPVICPNCNSNFDTLSDLHHHMRNDPDYIPCSALV
jgi:hypothetical protein